MPMRLQWTKLVHFDVILATRDLPGRDQTNVTNMANH